MAYRRPEEAPPILVTAAIIAWFLMSAFCVVVVLLLLLAVGFDRPKPVMLGLAGAVVFAIEARMVWVGLRADVVISAGLSFAFAALWFLIGDGESRGFAFVPPGLMVGAGIAAVVGRGAYLRWRNTGP